MPAPDSDCRRWFRAGGVSALAIGIAYVVTIGLFAWVEAPPSTGEAWMSYLAGKTAVWSVIIAVSVLTDVLYLPVAAALYAALKGVQRNLVLIGVALIALFVVLDLAVTWPNYAALVDLGREYAAAATDAERAAFVAAANYPAGVLSSRLQAVYSIVDLSSGILVIGVVMLRGVFNKATAYLGIATGVVGIATLTGFGPAVILNAVLATVWILFVGYRLMMLQ